MSLYQVTRHLDAAIDPVGSDKVLLIDLLQAARLLLEPEQAWTLLDRYSRPKELDPDDIVSLRAAQAGILRPVEEDERPAPLASRFDEISAKLLSYREVEAAPCLIERLQQLAQACRPVTDKRPSDYFIWQNPSRVFRILLDHLAVYFELEAVGNAVDDLPSTFVRQSLGRPACEQILEQQVCTLSTAWARAKRIAERFPGGGKVLFLGDDDLVSLALAHTGIFEIDVLEIDLKLVRLLRREGAGKLTVQRRDLSGGLPADYEGQYDVVVSDPMYSAEGMEMFVACCAPALKPGYESRLFLSTYPPLLEAPELFGEVLNDAGLKVLQTDENFNRYPFPEENRKKTMGGLINLGYHPKLVKVLTDIPYLYAHLYECRRA